MDPENLLEHEVIIARNNASFSELCAICGVRHKQPVGYGLFLAESFKECGNKYGVCDECGNEIDPLMVKARNALARMV